MHQWRLGLVLTSFAFVVGSCTTFPDARIPTIGYQSISVSAIEPDFGSGQLRLDVDLRFRFSNPLDRSLTIPGHEFHLSVDGEVLPFTVKQQESFVLEPQSVTDVVYPFVFDLGPNSPLAVYDLLGRDVPYQFVSSVEIALPFFLGNRTFTMSHDGEIRIPLLPSVQLASELPTLRLLGGFDTWNVAAIRNVMAPFVDLLINGEFLGQPVMDNLMGTLSIVDPGAGVFWQSFVTAWTSFMAGPGSVVVPTGLPDGIRLTIPFDIYNPNQFPIESPRLRADIRLAGRTTRLSRLDASPVGSTLIPPQQTRRMRVLAELRWSEIEGGMLSLLSGQSVNVDLDGEVTADVGYGPMRIPVSLALPVSVNP
jgi:LEA14-like dessication related protein